MDKEKWFYEGTLTLEILEGHASTAHGFIGQNWKHFVLGFVLLMFFGGLLRTCGRGLSCLPSYLKYVWEDFGLALMLLPLYLYYEPFQSFVNETIRSTLMLLATVGLVGLFLMILTNLFHVPRTDLVPTFLHLHHLKESDEWLLLPRNGVGHSNVGTFLAANAWSFKMLRRTSKATLGSPSLLDDVHTSKGQAYWLRFAGEAIGEAQGASDERILGALVRESNVYTRNPNSIWRILAAMITPSNRDQDDKFRKVFVKISHLQKLADPEFASKVKVERPCDIQKIAHA